MDQNNPSYKKSFISSPGSSANKESYYLKASSMIPIVTTKHNNSFKKKFVF